MKVEVEVSLSDEDRDAIADAVVAKLKASATIATASEPKKASEPKATKAKPKDEPKKDAEAPKVTTDVMLAKFRQLAEQKGKDAAVALLKKYADSVSGIPAEKLEEAAADVDAALKGGEAPAPAEADPFS